MKTTTFYRVEETPKAMLPQDRLPAVADKYRLVSDEFYQDGEGRWILVEDDGRKLNMDPRKYRFYDTPELAVVAYEERLVQNAQTLHRRAASADNTLRLFARIKDHLVRRDGA